MNSLNRLIDGVALSRDEARSLAVSLTDGTLPDSQIAAVLTCYAARIPTVEELAGFKEVLLEKSISINLGVPDAIDLCGTGGDGKETINISTLTSFLVASLEVRVIKHGNHGSSSSCGSSTILEAVGVKLHSDQSAIKNDIETSDIAFLHAPFFHPAVKEASRIRRELKIRTIFNLLGPLINPARPSNQLVGCATYEIFKLYTEYFRNYSTIKNWSVVYSVDGYDEISLTGEWLISNADGIKRYHPEQFGIKRIKAADIESREDIKTKSERFLHILQGQGSEEENYVIAMNAAFALALSRPEESIDSLFAECYKKLQSGKPFEVLASLIK